MSSQGDIFDALTRHQIFVLRYARGREVEAERFVAGTLKEVLYRLEETPLTEFSRGRLQDQARDLYAYLQESGDSYARSLQGDMQEFAGYEARFNQSVLTKNLGITASLPAPAQIQQAAFLDIMSLSPSRGYTLGGMIEEFGRHQSAIITNAIRQSITLGDTNAQMIKAIRDLAPMQKRKAATLARTAVNHAAVQARKEVLKENDDVLLGYEWVATLDSRTSLICMGRDGIIYSDYDKDPKPPAHFNCRSTITPVVDPLYDVGSQSAGTRPAKGSGGTTQVSGDLTYNDWLKTQPETFQDKVLGQKRAQLFRDGLPLDKFVDDSGRTLTLGELAQLDTEFNGGSIQDILDQLDRAVPVPIPQRPNLTTFSKPSQPQGGFSMTPMEQVRILDADDAKTRLRNWVKNNAKDPRQLDYARFSGRKYSVEGSWKGVEELDDDVARGFESCVDDMDKLCDLFNVPRLKGVQAISGDRTIANMGDAEMGLNNNLLRRGLLGLNGDQQAFKRINDVNTWQKTTRKLGGKAEWRRGRPWTVEKYLDNDYDRARSTFFHELGHHIHQMYGTKPSRRYWGANATPVELLMIKKYGKYTAGKRHSPSTYGDTNTKEWFAENFSAYFMGNKDKVDDLFVELIEELIRGAY
jgi:SPP1 gp7 family putative phage head morphogenesis protein